ncbi:hypothetical protein D9M68_796530 [compost metagenome]
MLQRFTRQQRATPDAQAWIGGNRLQGCIVHVQFGQDAFQAVTHLGKGFQGKHHDQMLVDLASTSFQRLQ